MSVPNPGMPSVASGPTSWVEWIGRASAATLLAALLITGYFGVWRWGSDYAEMKSDRDEWKALAMKGAQVAAAAANRVYLGGQARETPPTHASRDAVGNYLDGLRDRIIRTPPESQPQR